MASLRLLAAALPCVLYYLGNAQCGVMMRILLLPTPIFMPAGVPPSATALDGSGRVPEQRVEDGAQSPTVAIEAIGASTAAAGSSTSDAGVLPAKTANVYPTSAADDTKGVRINAADQITGRRIFIGNGVSNKILKVYPPSGGTVNGASADAAFSSVSGKGVVAICLSGSANTWLMF